MVCVSTRADVFLLDLLAMYTKTWMSDQTNWKHAASF